MSQLILVRFACGCVGTEPDAKGKSVNLEACDGDGPGAADRKMSAPYEPIDAEYAMVIWQKFNAARSADKVRAALHTLLSEVGR